MASWEACFSGEMKMDKISNFLEKKTLEEKQVAFMNGLKAHIKDMKKSLKEFEKKYAESSEKTSKKDLKELEEFILGYKKQIEDTEKFYSSARKRGYWGYAKKGKARPESLAAIERLKR